MAMNPENLKNLLTPGMKIALAGNPNSGKSSLFNALTGLNQKVGNYPGITVDKKTGFVHFYSSSEKDKCSATVIDLPGAYALHRNSEDEKISTETLTDPGNPDYPDRVVYVADASNLKRSLLFCSQIMDAGLPVVLALNMMDIAAKKGISIDSKILSGKLGIPVIPINARKNDGLSDLKFQFSHSTSSPQRFLNGYEKQTGNGNETLLRYQKIGEILKESVSRRDTAFSSITQKIDDILTHRLWGFAVFLMILFVIFQSIFSFSEIPMKTIESGFVMLNEWLGKTLPEGILKELLIGGILSGLSGIAVFIPQIALLFFFIAILEDSGYMARVSFIMDKIMRKFGLNGKSLIPMISGVACAVPAIMSARTITNRKERLLTILVTPLMTCSARIPVYILLIGLVIPDTKFLGILNLQGIALMGLYLIGFMAALLAALLMKLVIKSRERSYFVLEMPLYKAPRWSNIGLTMLEKVKVFVFDAGKIIIAISIILWALSSFGPAPLYPHEGGSLTAQAEGKKISTDEKLQEKKVTLENSYAAWIGKKIEPLIAPLGFDWKIGIALISSFAAREVFVGTMATLYGVEDADNSLSIREKMSLAAHPETGKKIYTAATCFSLIIFYAFAMQCMSTLAVVFRETKHWKWPLLQLGYMSALAWISSFMVFQLMK